MCVCVCVCTGVDAGIRTVDISRVKSSHRHRLCGTLTSVFAAVSNRVNTEREVLLTLLTLQVFFMQLCNRRSAEQLHSAAFCVQSLNVTGSQHCAKLQVFSLLRHQRDGSDRPQLFLQHNIHNKKLSSQC